MSNILTIKGLKKSYGRVEALKGLSLSVESGSVFGLLGPNGSGKTTTLAILLGILKSDEGDFSWFENGQDAKNRLRIGALLETPNFYPYLSAKQNLRVVAKIKKVVDAESRIEAVLKQVNLWERANSKFFTFSLGMKQRLALAAALVSDPEVLVLDEPTNGLDPQGIAEVRQLISEIAQSGKTIIIASHILDEIEKVSTHVAIMRQGELLNSGTLEDILGKQGSVLVSADSMSALKTALNTLTWVSVRDEQPKFLEVGLNEGKTTSDLNKAVFEQGVVLSTLKPQQRNLESIFLETIQA